MTQDNTKLVNGVRVPLSPEELQLRQEEEARSQIDLAAKREALATAKVTTVSFQQSAK